MNCKDCIFMKNLVMGGALLIKLSKFRGALQPFSKNIKIGCARSNIRSKNFVRKSWTFFTSAPNIGCANTHFANQVPQPLSLCTSIQVKKYHTCAIIFHSDNSKIIFLQLEAGANAATKMYFSNFMTTNTTILLLKTCFVKSLQLK